ncbi:hypothetical protein IMZ48_45070, partial [Candidatus Bathyarchaeota archaeon]|nr:hypothetical protein [Candidatus Bathyarchaeota archaeon]
LTYGGGEWAPIWATAFEGVKDGEAAVVTRHLGEILGREPEGFETTVRNMAAA